jgi:copper homeostasis protein
MVSRESRAERSCGYLEKRIFPDRRALIVVEAAVETLDAAEAAQRAGAGRIELCMRLDEGGTTPNPDLIALVSRAVTIPVFVLVRPRAGDFFYSDEELEVMREAIASAIDAGANGIVTGALTRDRRADADAMESLLEAARGVPLTFHRAFDELRDQAQTLEDLVKIGAARVLTSGGAPSASEGAETIAQLVRQSQDRICVVAGGNVRAHNVARILSVTRVCEVHARLVDERNMRDLVDVVRVHETSIGERGS